MVTATAERLAPSNNNNIPYPEINPGTIEEAYRTKKLFIIDPLYAERDREIKVRTHEGYDNNIFFLRADLSKIGSYKARGAGVVIAQAMLDVYNHNKEILIGRKEGEPITKLTIIAASEGNHAQGVAIVTEMVNEIVAHFKNRFPETFGLKDVVPEITAHIHMSGNADPTKVAGTKNFGKSRRSDKSYVKVIIADGMAYDVAEQSAEAEFEELTKRNTPGEKVIFVPPFNHPNTIKGAGTTFIDADIRLAEALEKKGRQLPKYAFVPLGGGGLTCGAIRHYMGTDTEVIPVGPSFNPSTIAGLINGGKPIYIRNTDRHPHHIHIGGATIAKGGDVTLKILYESKINVYSAHPEQCAWLLNEHVTKQFGYKTFEEYVEASTNDGPETRRIPEHAALQGAAHFRSYKDKYKTDRPILITYTGSNIDKKIANEEVNYALAKHGDKYPEHLSKEVPFYDHKNLVGSLASIANVVDDRRELENLKNNWILDPETKEFRSKENSEKKLMMLTDKLENTLYTLTMSTINEIEKKRNIPLRRDQAVQKEKLKDLIVTWADEGRFNEEERAALLDRIKPQLGRKKVGESN